MVGLSAGILGAQAVPREHQAIHLIFAAVGGIIGSIAPDVIEPATSPNHRALFHSLFTAGSLGAAAVADFAADCHRTAAECDGRAHLCISESRDRNREEGKAFLLRVIAGLIVGFISGYASHLLLDAATKRGLPILTTGY